MNKNVKITIIVFCTIITLILTSLLYFGITKKEALFKIVYKYEEEKKMVFLLDDINSIEVYLKNEDIDIYFTDEEEITVIQKIHSNKKHDKNLFLSSIDNKVLTISSQEKENSFCFGMCFNFNSKYQLYIPKSYQENIKIKNTSGNISFKDEIINKINILELSSISGDINVNNKVWSSNLIINTSSGKIITKQIESDELYINNISGDIKINDIINSKLVIISTLSGNIKTNNIKGDEIKLASISGDIRNQELKGNVFVETTSGYIKSSITGSANIQAISGNVILEKTLFLNNSQISTTSGDINIKLNRNSSCKIEANTRSGNIKLPKAADGNHQLDLNTISGDIKISIVE